VRPQAFCRTATRLAPIAASLLLLLSAASCSRLFKVQQELRATRAMFGGTMPFEVQIDHDANQNTPIAVDLVVVYDAKLLDKLESMNAETWFQKRTQFLADNAEMMSSWSWEWVPGQVVSELSVPYRAGAQQFVIFADYEPAPDVTSDYRVQIGPQSPFRLILQEKTFSIERFPWRP
jgi:type VI secretion system protein